MTYDEYEIVLKPGSSMLLYTDGVTETENTGHAQFGTGNLVNTLNSHDRADADPDFMLDCIYGRLKEFAGDAPQFDDITMLFVRYLGENQIENKNI